MFFGRSLSVKRPMTGIRYEGKSVSGYWLFQGRNDFKSVKGKGKRKMEEKRTAPFKWVVCLLLLMFCFGSFNIVSEAATTVKSGSVTIYKGMYSNISFTLPSSGVVSIKLEISLEKNRVSSSKDKYVVRLCKPDPEDDLPRSGDIEDADEGIRSTVEKDSSTLAAGYSSGTFNNEFYCPTTLSSGKYVYQIQNKSALHDYKIKYTIYSNPCIATSFSVGSTSVSVTGGKEKAISLKASPSNAYLVFDKVSASSKNLEWWIDDNKLYVYSDKAGTYKITLSIGSNSKTIKVKVKNPSKPKLKYTSCIMYTGDTVKNTLRFTSKTVKWSSSDKKVATVSKNGKIKATGVGTAKITAKAGSKKYVCKVKVKRQPPDFFARVTAYNTRSNYFTVKFYNNSNKSLKILTSSAKAMHVKYTSYDRNLTVNKGKSVTIKPGKSAKIKFYVKGRTTWYDYKRFTLSFKFKFDNKQYTGHVWNTDSSYKKSGKWYTTYIDKDVMGTFNW